MHEIYEKLANFLHGSEIASNREQNKNMIINELFFSNLSLKYLKL